LAVPDGITLVFLPPYSPELQPAERLWPLVDEPVANKHFATLDDLDAVVAERCRRLDPAAIKPHTAFHWWPKPNPAELITRRRYQEFRAERPACEFRRPPAGHQGGPDAPRTRRGGFAPSLKPEPRLASTPRRGRAPSRRRSRARPVAVQEAQHAVLAADRLQSALRPEGQHVREAPDQVFQELARVECRGTRSASRN
jgi:hypothetical protein